MARQPLLENEEMNITRIKIENFKGLKQFETDFGENTVIKGKNGVGKTSIYDAFLWLLFGKDSDGKKEFGLRPVDSNNNPIEGVQLSVEADIDGHTYRKVNKEKHVKGQHKGFETACYIDEVPKKAGEYASAINALMPEDTFKLLTNLTYFNNLHWQDRRKVLLEIAGEIGTPEGFGELVETLNGRKIDDYKKVLSDRRKLLKKDRDEIGPRIDEIQRGLTEYATDEDLTNKREVVLADLELLSQNRESIHSKEVARQLQLDEISQLKRDRGDREAELKADTSNVQSLIDEKTKIAGQVGGFQDKVLECEREINGYQDDMHRFKDILETDLHRLETIRKEYKEATAAPVDDTCYACGQQLPPEKVKEVEAKKHSKIQSLIVDGNSAKEKVDDIKSDIEGCQAKYEDSTKRLADLKQQVTDAEKYKVERFAEIDKAIESNETTPPMMDDKWKGLSAKINALEADVGTDVAGQIKDIDDQILAKQDELAEYDRALAQADQSAESKARIKELSAKEKELSQSIADIDKQVHEVEQYQAEVSTMVEGAVNGKFDSARFKLFNELLNGSVEPCCITTYNGVEYPDMSGGQKIYIGIDIVNVLSKHYKRSAPLFIDNSESLTLPVITNSQTIQLFAVDGMDLTVEREIK
jgi:DNA repair exonuclease SbcCD ATPase subunit